MKSQVLKRIVGVALVVLMVSSCASSKYVRFFPNTCSVAEDTYACSNYCNFGFNDSNRPLWCYRLFCQNGTDNYGQWCNGFDPNIFPPISQIAEIRSEQSYIIAIGALAKSSLQDNNLAFAVAMARSDGVQHGSSGISVIGNSVGLGGSGAIYGDTGGAYGTVLRYKIVDDSNGPHVELANYACSGSGCPTAVFGDPKSTADMYNWYQEVLGASGASHVFSRGSTQYVFMLQGFRRGNVQILGFSGDNSKNYVYNALDNFISWKDAATEGANYQNLATKIITSIHYDTNNTPKNTMLLNFEGLKDSSQLAQGFDILMSSGKNQTDVSFLSNSCPPGVNCEEWLKRGDTVNNASAIFSESILRKYFVTGTPPSATGESKIITATDIYMIAEALEEKLGNGLGGSAVVVGSGTSSISNNQSSHKLFFGNANYTPDPNNNWLKELPWYKDYNIFQTHGSVWSWLVYQVQSGTLSPSDYNKYVTSPLYYYGNQSFDTANQQNGPIANANIALVQNMDLTQNLNMAYTSNYPAAFLYHLWQKEGYQTSAATLSIGGNGSSSFSYVQKFAYLNSNALGAQYLDVNYMPLLTKSYSSSNSYNFLVAGALDASGIFTDGKSPSLAIYSNAAGQLKYNYVTVSTSSLQSVMHPKDGPDYLNQKWTTPPTSVTGDSESDFQIGFPMVYGFNNSLGQSALQAALAGITANISASCKAGTLTACTQDDMKLIAQEKPNITAHQYLYSSPSQVAATMLSGYISRIQEIFPNATTTQITFALRNGATPMYGTNYNLHIDGHDVIVKQASFYFTKQFGDSTGEVDSLNTLNREAGRDVFVFTGDGLAGKQYDSLYDQMFTASGHNGYGKVDPSQMIVANIFGIKYNTSFFTGEAQVNNVTIGGQNFVQTSIGGNVFNQFLYETTTPTPTNPISNFDPRTEIEDSAGGVLNHTTANNSFLAVDFASQMNIKFNWQAEPQKYYAVRFIDCTDGATGACDANKYQDELDQYYDNLQKEQGGALIPGKDRVMVNLKVDTNGVPHLCSQADADNNLCTYDYQNYEDVSLKYFNDAKNVLMLAVSNDAGQFEVDGKKISMAIYTLDADLTPIVSHQTGVFKIFEDLNKLIDDVSNGTTLDIGKLKSIGITQQQVDDRNLEAILNMRVSNQCLYSLECSQHDLMVMFQLNPNLFVKAPSNIFGNGNIDLQNVIMDITYQNKYFNGNTDLARNTSQIQQFFYNPSCSGTNCGVSTASELGFQYTPPGKTIDAFDVRPFLFRHSSALIKPYLTSDNFATNLPAVRAQVETLLQSHGYSPEQITQCLDQQICSPDQLNYIYNNKLGPGGNPDPDVKDLVRTIYYEISELWSNRDTTHNFIGIVTAACMDDISLCTDFEMQAIIKEDQLQNGTNAKVAFNEPILDYIKQEIIAKNHLSVSPACQTNLSLCSETEMKLIKANDTYHIVVAGDTWDDFIDLYKQNYHSQATGAGVSEGCAVNNVCTPQEQIILTEINKVVSFACQENVNSCSWDDLQHVQLIAGDDITFNGNDWVVNHQGSDSRIVLGYNITPYGREPITYDNLSHAMNFPNDAPGMMLSYVLGAAGPAVGFNSLQQIVTNKSAFGGQLIASAATMSGSVMVGNQLVNTNSFSVHSFTNADRNSDYNGYFINDGLSLPSQVVSGIRYTQDLTETTSMKAMFFGNKNELDLINTSHAGGVVNDTSIYMFSPDQQGMFGNPYIRYAGGFAGSAYSISGHVLDERVKYRFSSIQSNNPASAMFGFNGPLGVQGYASNIFGINMNQNNMLQEAQVMYSTKDNKSAYSISVGFLQQEGGLLSGTYANPNIGNNTAYVDVKIIQHLGKGFYLMGHYNAGFLSVTGTTKADLFNAVGLDPMFLQSFSVGFMKEGILGGTMFFIYNEPNRVISGELNMTMPNKDGELVTSMVGVEKDFVERHYEFGYSRKIKGYNVSLSAIMRQHPYRIATSELDQVVMLRFSGPC